MLAKVGKEIAEETIRYNEAVENYQGAQTFQKNATDNARRSGMPMSQSETMFLCIADRLQNFADEGQFDATFTEAFD